MKNNVYKTDLNQLGQVKRGKVRDVYNLDDKLLIVSTDRISAFDVIMEQTIPQKGIILNTISKFWLENTTHIIDNHFVTDDMNQIDKLDNSNKSMLQNRAMIVRKTKVIPIECVVRGYIAGSGWKEYQQNKMICGYKLTEDLIEFDKLPEPIFTPATKEETGHDQNITFDQMKEIIGEQYSEFLKKKSIELYNYAYEYLLQRGIILADTKFEFGVLENGKIILIDEALTPDSSRFWLQKDYIPGKPQYNFDKQILRDYLLSIDWDKNPPPPKLPNEIITQTRQKYEEAYCIILDKKSFDK